MILNGNIIIQQHMCGVTHQKAENLKEALTPSAAYLKKLLEGPDADNSNENDSRSTESYYFKIEDNKGIDLLDHIDRVGDDEAFKRKLETYLQVCDSRVKTRNYKSLPISERIEAYKTIQGVSFPYYSYQVIIKLDKGDGSEVKFINSKKHKRLTAISENEAHDKVRAFIQTWIGIQAKNKRNEGTTGSKTVASNGSSTSSIGDVS